MHRTLTLLLTLTMTTMAMTTVRGNGGDCGPQDGKDGIPQEDGNVAGAAIDPAARYPARLDFDPDGTGHDWTANDKDVLKLKSFAFAVGDKLKLECGPATVVFGHADTTVLWAWLAPEEPGQITSTVAGNGEKFTSVWMRFHPSRLGELFPQATVAGPGHPSNLIWARRHATWKIKGSWNWRGSGRPQVPPKNAVILDADTTDGHRRYYDVDTESGVVKPDAEFFDLPVPKPTPISKDDAVKAFDDAWDAFDREYAKFVLVPKVDWSRLREQYRPQAAAAATREEVADALAQMLAHLEDLHVFVYAGNQYFPGYTRFRYLNASWKAIQASIPDVSNTGKEIAWGRTADGIGYMNVYGMSSLELPDEFDHALEKLADTWALIIDVRGNGGGDEMLGRSTAGRFADEAAVYAYSRYRNGPKHTDLGSFLPRAFEPRGPWRYQSPVIVLCGQLTMSSAESFVQMLAECPQVTTMGDRTAGASANPKLLRLPGDISVNLPRWIDFDARKTPFENVGIQPDVGIKTAVKDFDGEEDPVLEAALKHLRELPKESRKPGRRQSHRNEKSGD
ncbi:MAG: hypothetical protein C4547_14245 [Phycisphaerales bacterium]|nr:MAG: hypothetical protein C4547_14245 [Phycisphaerales bacterium]